jgi:hypothetical protein
MLQMTMAQGLQALHTSLGMHSSGVDEAVGLCWKTPIQALARMPELRHGWAKWMALHLRRSNFAPAGVVVVQAAGEKICTKTKEQETHCKKAAACLLTKREDMGPLGGYGERIPGRNIPLKAELESIAFLR